MQIELQVYSKKGAFKKPTPCVSSKRSSLIRIVPRNFLVERQHREKSITKFSEEPKRSPKSSEVQMPHSYQNPDVSGMIFRS